MSLATILSRLGWLLVFLSLGMIPPTAFAVSDGDGRLAFAFFISASVTVFIGVGLILAMRGLVTQLNIRSAIILLLAGWTVIPAFAALPFFGAGLFPTFGEAYFESVSGLTTTGATLVTDLAGVPDAVLIWRGILQWFGGLAATVIAAVVLAAVVLSGVPLAVLPMPWLKDHSTIGRMDATFRVILPFYAGATAIVAIWAAFGGVPVRDAICLALSAVSTGGFTAHEADLAAYGQPMAMGGIMFGMIFGALNIFLHFQGFRGRFTAYANDRESVYFLWFFLLAAILILTCLSFAGKFAPASGIFMTLSLTSTSGFVYGGDAMHDSLPTALVLWLCLAGGASVSTAGGMKIIRVALLVKLSRRELARLAHPHGIVRVIFNGHRIEERVLARVGAILTVYIIAIGIVSMLLAFFGADFGHAISAAVSAVSNTGPALGLATAGEAAYTDFSSGARWVLVGAMILGRVEVLALLALVNPAYWRA